MKKLICVLGFVLGYMLFWFGLVLFAHWWNIIPYQGCWSDWNVVLTVASCGWIPGLLVYYKLQDWMNTGRKVPVVKHGSVYLVDPKDVVDGFDFIRSRR